ncbi:MAG TPA: mechanosensitive ion channel domain-containing protein, partial [Bacillales bacterium]|nr:mechanosensitive ion channel domain-containing protein [Bacillales bacterium]
FLENLYSGFSGYSDAILFSLIVLAGAMILYFIIHYFLSRAATALDLKDRKVKGINSIMKMTIIVITITIILFQFSSISGAAAGAISVVVGTIIGFSSRNTISNAIAGIILLSARPFKIGDRISTTDDDSLLGDVVEITLIYTKIETIKNELVTIPNQSLLQNQIVNYSGFQYLAVAVEIGVGYEEDKEKVKSLFIESASSTPGIISDNPKPYVILKRFENFAAIFELRAYTKRSNEFMRIQSDIREKIYELFQLRGIDLSTPYSVHLNQFQDIARESSRKKNTSDI